MEIVLLSQAEEDLNYWKSKSDTRILKRIRALLEDIQQHPFSGIGKPELLKGSNGKWSRSLCDTIIPNKLIRSVPPFFVLAQPTPGV